ncbi:MAG: RNA polymerase sigma-54 factor [Planctomycetota bacterium]|jgi:RNA polymerase sigma-54 factor
MLPALAILELGAMELSGYLREQYESNEALTLEEPRRGEESPLVAQTATEAGRDGSLDHSMGGDFFEPVFVRRGSAEATDRHAEWLETQPARDRGLLESVEEQLAFLDFRALGRAHQAQLCALENPGDSPGLAVVLGPDLEPIVRFLVGELDGRGVLLPNNVELLTRAKGLQFGPNPEVSLEAAIEVLQDLSPRGIGARSAVGMLLMQMDPSDEDSDLMQRLLGQHLEDLGKNKLPQVAAALGISVAEVVRLLERLRDFDREVSAQHEASHGQVAPAILPDVIVEEDRHGFTVSVDGAALPKVAIDEDISQLARDSRHDPDLRTYLRSKIDSARLIVDAVEQRRTTLLRVSRALFSHQRAFLEHGPGHLAPLRMGALAEMVGVHRSTVSRAIAGKYAWTPWGMVCLRDFFQGSAGSSDATARVDVREQVRQVVEAEDPAAPLSDEEIVLGMGQRGFKLARRTVAKYRRELGLASSYRRRRFAA